MSSMKLMYADDIYDIPYEEKDGLKYPKFESYGRAQMSPTARKALDLMNETDKTALEMINISGLYRTIWEEIAAKAEQSRALTEETLKKKMILSGNYEARAAQLTAIETQSQSAAWDTIRQCVNWLSAEIWSRGMLTEIANINLSMMTS